MKRKYQISLIIALFTILSIPTFGQAGSIAFSQYINSTGYQTEWIINVNELKGVRFTYTTDVFYGLPMISIYELSADGVTYNNILTISGYNTGSVCTNAKTGKAKVVFNACAIGYAGFNIQYSADNSIQTNSDLQVGGNGIITGNLTINSKLSVPSTTVSNSMLGKLGIGTTTPQFNFHIRGVNSNSDKMTLGTTSTGNFALTSADGGPYGLFAGISNTGRAWLQAGRYDTNTAYDLNFQTAGGNVGIGTTTPLRKLVIQGPDDGTPQIRVQGTADQTSYWEFGRESLSTGDFFITNNHLGTIAKRLTIQDTSGNFAIGDQTPASKLDVGGEITMPFNKRIGSLLSDAFSSVYTDNKPMGHYSLGWFSDSQSNGSVSLWMSGYGGMKFFTGGSPRLAIDVSGNVGIGTTTPKGILDVNTNLTEQGEYTSQLWSTSNPDYNLRLQSEWNGYGINQKIIQKFQGNDFTSLSFFQGKVGIGTNKPDALLTVNGTIHAKEVMVDLSGSLADYVFNTNYKLMPLNQVEQYVKTNSHLPEIPSASEVSKNGMNMGEMQNKLLQKIEELTLYMIDQQKTINFQSAKIEELEKKLK